MKIINLVLEIRSATEKHSVQGSGIETTIIIISSHQHRVSNYNLESAVLDVVRVQIEEGFPVIDDSMRDVDMGPSEF